MSETHSKESDSRPLSHICLSVKRHSSVEDSECDARQNSPESIPVQAEFVMAGVPESSLKAINIDLQSARTLILSRMDKMKSNRANIFKTNNLLHERITTQVQDKVSLHSGFSSFIRASRG